MRYPISRPPLYALAMALLALVLVGCGPQAEEAVDEVADQFLTEEATVLADTPTPEPTQVPPTETPSVRRVSFSDPEGDIQNCQTGAALEGDYGHIDVSGLTFEADANTFSVSVGYAYAGDWTEFVASQNSYFGAMMLEDPENPQAPDPNLGNLGIGYKRIDIQWDGQGFGTRAWTRDEQGNYVEEQGTAELETDAGGFTLSIDQAWTPGHLGTAGYAAVQFEACDFAGVEFDFSSGSASDGMLTIDIDDLTVD